MRLLVALAGLACVLSAGAGAHPGDEYDVLTAQDGDALAYVSPQAPVVKADREVVLAVDLLNASTFTPEANLTLQAEGPKERLEAPVRAGPEGNLARLVFPTEGIWNLTLRGDGLAATVRLDVYPPSDYHVDASAARYGLHYAGLESRIPFAFIHDERGPLPANGMDAQARIERVDPNGTLLRAEEKPLEHNEEGGGFVLSHRFTETGAYLVRLQSDALRLEYDDLPPVRIHVRPGHDPDAAQEAPGPSFAALILALAAALGTRRAPPAR